MPCRFFALAAVVLASPALACTSLLECSTQAYDEPQTALARAAYGAITVETPAFEVRELLGQPTAVTLPGDTDPAAGDFELFDPAKLDLPGRASQYGPSELAILWYENGHCGPIAITLQELEGKTETVLAGAALLCVTDPGKPFPFHPPLDQRCDGGRKAHHLCR